jgi:hypothetical protein
MKGNLTTLALIPLSLIEIKISVSGLAKGSET